jgi:spore coat polysaccharide biosynthesis predicted glycosyltransferase SpsG
MLLGGYAAGTVYDSLYRAVGFSCDGTQFSKMYNHVLEPPVQANLIALGNAPKKVVVRVIEYLTFTDTKNIMLAMSV